jgi:DNA-binding MarR family transcriptional regulator
LTLATGAVTLRDNQPIALQRGIWLELYAVYHLFGAVLARSLEQDLVAREFALYSTLFGLEGATTTDIAKVVGLPLTTASDQLNRLVSRGHATRAVNPADRRSHVFALTDEGRRVTSAHFESFGVMARRIRGRLPIEEARIREGLVALEGALREELRDLDPANAPVP